MSEVISFETALELFVQNYRKKQLEEIRKGFRLDEENWKTINGNHVLIDSDTGEIKVGPKALKDAVNGKISGAASDGDGYKKYGKTHSERMAFRKGKLKGCKDKLSERHDIVKIRYEIMKAKQKYVRMFDAAEKKYEVLDGVTEDNLSEKIAEMENKWKRLNRKYDEAYLNEASDEKLRSIDKEIRKANEDIEVLRNYSESKQKLDELRENRGSYDRDYELARKDLDDAVEESKRIIENYKSEVAEVNREISKKYPDYDSIKSVKDAEEYLMAKGYFYRDDTEDLRFGRVDGEPRTAHVDLGNATLENAIAFCKTADKIYEKYPDLAGTVGYIGVEGLDGNYGEYGDGALTLSDTMCSNNKAPREDILFHPRLVSGEPQTYHRYVLAHEFGHAIDEYFCRKYEDLWEYRSIPNGLGGSRNIETVAPAILKQTAKNLGITQAELKKRISDYACKNPLEALAEAFSEYAISDEPRAEAMEIGRQIDSLYSTGKLAGKEKI